VAIVGTRLRPQVWLRRGKAAEASNRRCYWAEDPPRAVAAYVEKVYEDGSFSSLGIGS